MPTDDETSRDLGRVAPGVDLSRADGAVTPDHEEEQDRQSDTIRHGRTPQNRIGATDVEPAPLKWMDRNPSGGVTGISVISGVAPTAEMAKI